MSRPRILPDHGSYTGYKRHRDAGEDACEACLRAWREYGRQAYRTRRMLLLRRTR